MPIIRKRDTQSFQIPGLTVRRFASPQGGSKETSVWQISLAAGAPGLPHTVTREEIFVATAGAAQATIEGKTQALGPGDVLIVPAGVEFTLANRADVPFEAFVAFP
ncbi:MAG TPA: cupin domain-containing protein, partial [bacterium]